MVDWATISSLATAGGTLVLAVATFASVRSANRAARNAERALQVGLRPVLFASRPQDPDQKIRWGDDHWAHVSGGQAVLETTADGFIYFAMSLRNVGSGLAVLHGWRAERLPTFDDPTIAVQQRRAAMTHPDPETFRPQGRDLYVPPSDISFWQAAIRDSADPQRAELWECVEGGHELMVDLLYGDHEGGQRTISRFSITRSPRSDEIWLCAVVRHWYLDRQDPR